MPTEIQEELLSKPHVIGVGIMKEGDDDVIVVFVTEKVPESSLSENEIIPTQIEVDDRMCRTDVIQSGKISSL